MAGLLSPAVQSGLLGPGVDVDQTPEMNIPGGLLRLGQQIGQGLLQVGGLPQRVFAGEVDPLSDEGIRQTTNLAGLLAGGGVTTAGARASGLGVFGGQIRHPSGPARVMPLGSQGGLINQRIRTPTGAEGFVSTRIQRSEGSRNTVDLDLNFTAKNPETGVFDLAFAGLPVKEGRKLFTAAINEARRHIEQVRPAFVTFQAATPQLLPIYRRLAKQIAKETGGKAIFPKNRFNPFFRVKLPNPRVFIGA